MVVTLSHMVTTDNGQSRKGDLEMATASKEGSRCANSPLLTEKGSDII